MKYSYEFKIKCVEAYKGRDILEIPKGISSRAFKKKVRSWVRLYDLHGPDVLKHKGQNTMRTPDEKMTIVVEALAGNPINTISIKHGIQSGIVYQWVRKYKTEGYNGLIDKPKGRKRKEGTMKKNTTMPEPLTPSEREELLLLRERTKAMEAEIAAIKKERALRLERWENALKAEKRKSSKN